MLPPLGIIFGLFVAFTAAQVWSDNDRARLCALLAIAFVHCDDRLSSLVAMGLFATGVSASVLLIAAHDRPFVGEVAVTPKPLLQIVSALQITSANDPM